MPEKRYDRSQPHLRSLPPVFRSGRSGLSRPALLRGVASAGASIGPVRRAGRLAAPTLPIRPVHDAGPCGGTGRTRHQNLSDAPFECSCGPRFWVSKKGSADRADGEGQHAVAAAEKTDRQEKFGIAGAEEAEGPEADTKGEEQAPDVAPNPSGAKERRPVSKIVSITCGLQFWASGRQ
ncbi:hypothetical protein DLJ82_3820 [Rhizobium leguminosarum]|uniref:Uncharacterized protein n=1 Tax=Rhizobium leguminosarum TaxID=384 RepID=A0A2Z4YJF9_RHILE|nr:hypothetical protein DLJ82_3820 [Rhizobium leguminosarum]